MRIWLILLNFFYLFDCGCCSPKSEIDLGRVMEKMLSLHTKGSYLMPPFLRAFVLPLVLFFLMALTSCFSVSYIQLKNQNSLSSFARFDQTIFYNGTSNPNSVLVNGVCFGVEQLKFLVSGAEAGMANCLNSINGSPGSWSKTIDISGQPEGAVTIKILDPVTNSEYATLTGQKDLTVPIPNFVELLAPTSSFTTNPTITVRFTNLEVGSTVQIFTSFCSGSPWTTVVASSSTEDFTMTLPTYGTYGFNLNQIDRAGNLSSCGYFSNQYSYAKELNVVSTTVVSNPDALTDGICADATGQCSFRAALNEASADPFTPFIINIAAGTYSYAACTNISTSNAAIKLVGAGPSLTIFDGNSTNRALCSGGFGFSRLHLKDIQFREFNGSTNDIFANAGSANYEIDNAEFRNNVSGTYGVLSFRNYYSVKNSLFEGNSGSYVTYSWGVNGSIDRCRYINNTTSYGHRSRHGLLNAISDTTISGGQIGIYIDRSTVVNLTNITLSGNSSAGLNVSSSSGNVTVNITNSTFYNNGTAANGNLYLQGSGADVRTLNVSNSIFAINNLKTNCVGDLGNYILNFANSIFDEASCGAGAGNLVGIDPLLGPLANNGGTTNTHLPTALSPAIDAGDNAQCTSTDQRGFPRPVQKVAGSAICDIGAVEVQ